jgi:hypothetical protein
MILSTRACSVRQNVHSGVPWTAMLANYQGAHIGGSVESAWGAVPGLLLARFPRPLAEPGVPVSGYRALHGSCRQAWLGTQGLGIVRPR